MEKYIQHDVLQPMLRQRIFGIAQGYEDLNDHDALRHCVGMQTAVGSLSSLCKLTYIECRFEKMINSEYLCLVQVHYTDFNIEVYENLK